jgi:tetratricopeptide (TPR) repeat protein
VVTLRTFAVMIVLLVGALPVSAVAPPRGPIAGWIEDLASEDAAVWRAAVDRLWKAGRAAEPGLRKALKHRDVDVVLRARLILGRFDWGIFPDTPPAIVRVIERYRDGDAAQRRKAAEELIDQGKPGYVVLRRLLARETDEGTRQHVAQHLQRRYRPLVRDLLAANDRSGAEQLLEAAAAAGSLPAISDLAALWVLTGQAGAKARLLEPLVKAGDKKAALRCAYLHRANGDLAAARRAAEKADDPELLGGILLELEDFKALGELSPPFLRSAARKATVRHHAGDREGFEACLRQIPVTDHTTRAHVFYANDRPREGIEADRKSHFPAGACKLLALQGRYREALSLEADPKAPDQRLWLLLEQAAVSAQRMGEKEKAGKLLALVMEGAEKSRSWDGLLGEAVRAADRMNQRQEIVKEIAVLLDRMKPATPPHALLAALFRRRDGQDLVLWWDFLRRKSPETAPSHTLARLRGWFEEGKADKDFDTLIADAEPAKTLPADEQDRWRGAMARACLAVGKTKKAEEILQAGTKGATTAAPYLRLGDFYFKRREWKQAAAEYQRGLEHDRTAILALYLRGVALMKAGQLKEGRVAIERARLLPLADEAARYYLAEGLARRGLRDEADDESLVLVSTAPFRSVYATNASSQVAARAARQKRYLEAARYHRRVYLHLTFGGGAFLDSTAYLRVPAWAHRNQARGLLAAGKLDEALVEGRIYLDYLPQEVDLVIDLVRALDKAKRKADADRLFEGILARHQRGCVDTPRVVDCHNRLAWLAVRCGRRLDLALRHARTATRLAPDAPGCLDTLAEIHFQRGEKDEAVALMKKAIKLAPKQPYFAAALRRIEAGDRDADLPER